MFDIFGIDIAKEYNLLVTCEIILSALFENSM